MCDQRDQLIDYLYDACEPDDRRRVEAHIEVCPECRTEISDLRRVRQDLLAWDVPEHGSVWKPFVPVRVTPWWREVPAWAFATAASVMFLLGAAGGFATRALMPIAAEAPVTSSQVSTVPASADLTDMERRILDRLRAELTQQMQVNATHSTAAVPAPGRVLRASSQIDQDRLLHQVSDLIGASERRQTDMLTELHNATMTLWKRADAKAESAQTNVDLIKVALSQQGR